MQRKKIFRLLMIIGAVFIVSSLIVSSACGCCPKQVKIKEIPIPWQSWATEGGAVVDIIQLPPDFAERVTIIRQWTPLPRAIALEDLTSTGTEGLMKEMGREWMGSDKEPVPLKPGGEVKVSIPVTEGDAAVLVQYTVALASAPAVVMVHAFNQVALAQVSPQVIIGDSSSNFEVHNNTGVQVDNFEFDLYGLKPSDVSRWYSESGGYHWENQSWGRTLYGGWGTPPDINNIPGGIEVKWKDASYPIDPCQWVHFGLTLEKGVQPTSARAYWTRLCR